MPNFAGSSSSTSNSNPGRRMFVAGAVGAALVIGLIVGVLFIQTDSNVSEITRSTSSSYSTSSTTNVASSETTTTSHSTTAYSGPTGFLGVSLTDPPIVPPGVTNVYIAYSSIQVHVADAGNQDGWYVVADSGSVDLMSLLNVSLTLGSVAVQIGVFNLISFNITSASITLNGANETAYVPANRINVPITGGVTVSDGNSSGVLVDLSPQVIPYQNGTSISYVLVPQARSLPIPRDVWNYKLETRGIEAYRDPEPDLGNADLGPSCCHGSKVTPNSFSLTLQNQGTANATFSSIAIG